MVDALNADTRATEQRGLSEDSTSDTDGKTNDSAKERHISGSNVVRTSATPNIGAMGLTRALIFFAL